MKVVLSLSCVLLLISTCYGYPTGAPTSACEDLLPKHPVRGPDGQPTGEYYEPQTTTSPYVITVEPQSFDAGSVLTVTISGHNFRGYILRAFDGNGEPINGEFQEKREVQTIECDSAKDTATHVSKKEKTDLTMEWKSPENYSGSVIFKGTVLESYAVFWQVESEPVTTNE